MPITQPRKDGEYPDRDIDCEEALEASIQDVMQRAQQQGWNRAETMDAIENLIANLRIAYAEYPI